MIKHVYCHWATTRILFNTFTRTFQNKALELKNVRYDFNRREFIGRDGVRTDRAILERRAQQVRYVVLASTVIVEMDYELKDTRTGTVLWQATEQVVQSSGGAGGGLIGIAIAAAVNAMATDYQPLARQANNQVFLPPKGIPAGPYHVEYGRDQEKF